MNKKVEKIKTAIKQFRKENPDFDWDGLVPGEFRSQDTKLLSYLDSKGFTSVKNLISALKEMKKEEKQQ